MSPFSRYIRLLRPCFPLSPLSAAAVLAISTPAWGQAPNLSETFPVLEERFEDGLDLYDGRKGLWSTLPRRGELLTNAAETVFYDSAILPPDIVAETGQVRALTDEGLSLRTVALIDPARPAVQDYMRRTGQGGWADNIRYVTGQINTLQTWAQTYGYFEIEAQIPRGQGRWPAFWLTFAGPGWPPEIDVMEAFGEGIARPTGSDGRFDTAVLFDAYDAEGEAVHEVEIVNPHDGDPDTRVPRVKTRGGREVYTLSARHQQQDLGANIYDAINTYAAMWTPDEIVFYFGPDPESLREIYRVPTPDDVHVPMSLIANDQFTARGGWWPADRAIGAVLDPENDFLIRSITLRVLTPGLELDMSAGDTPFDDRDSVVRDTDGDDVIAPGDGFDVLRLSGGTDEIRLSRGRHNKIIEGFGPEDRLVLEGFPFADAADAVSRLTQVGGDVWLTAAADPFWPQTIILQGVSADALREEQFVIRWPVGADIWLARAELPTKAQLDEDGDGVLQADSVGSRLKDDAAALRMIGGPGPDEYLVANSETRIEEIEGGGLDTMIAWGAQVLPPHVERGILRGGRGRLSGTDGADRLEARGERLALAGGTGDDLYVIAPESRDVTVRIEAGRGHDRLRGLTEEHRVDLAPTLRARAAERRVEPVTEGTLVTFGPEQSLLVEGMAPAAVEAQLAP